jgi:pyridoxine/pyridoxamine 5'-phosphate oxidase
MPLDPHKTRWKAHLQAPVTVQTELTKNVTRAESQKFHVLAQNCKVMLKMVWDRDRTRIQVAIMSHVRTVSHSSCCEFDHE